MNVLDVMRIIKWTRDFENNNRRGDSGEMRDMTTREIRQAADYYLAGKDAWESAAAISENRKV